MAEYDRPPGTEPREGRRERRPGELSRDSDVPSEPVGVYDRPGRGGGGGSSIWGVIAIIVILALIALLLIVFVL